MRKLRDLIDLTSTITPSVSFDTDDVNVKVAGNSFENRFYSKAIQKLFSEWIRKWILNAPKTGIGI